MLKIGVKYELMRTNGLSFKYLFSIYPPLQLGTENVQLWMKSQRLFIWKAKRLPSKEDGGIS